jgi:hypothetical protein
LDDVARTYIEEKGYGEYFIHSLGHGFGVCVHEPPLLSSGLDEPLFGLNFNNEPLTPIDAITIEPGIYIEDWFGIRIEDDYLVDVDGHEPLTEDLPRDLDWFMIMEDDYPALPQHKAGMDDSDAGEGVLESVPLPFGIVETLAIACVVAVLVPRRAEPELEDDVNENR